MMAFIHIPKTGGSYVVQRKTPKSRRVPVVQPMVDLHHTAIVTGDGIPNWLYFPHDRKNWNRVNYKSEISNNIIFTNVRNPFSWLVSYACAAGDWAKEGLTDHYDYEIAKGDFKSFVKAVAMRTEPWPSKKFLFWQMFCNDGDMMVDWINRMETLDRDLELMADYYRLSYEKKEMQLVGKHKDYREYYDAELREIVKNTWHRELGLFGYTFNGYCEKPIIVNNNKLKNGIKYYYNDDVLIVTGEEYVGRQ